MQNQEENKSIMEVTKKAIVRVAKMAGFCPGVSRAIKAVNDLLAKNCKVCTLGEIIHNSYVVDDFKNRGVMVVNSPSDVPKGYTVVIRSHGCARDDLKYIENSGIPFFDATCPFVKKIHNIVNLNEHNREILLAAGDANHPEMVGIRSYFNGKSYVFRDKHELESIINKDKVIGDKRILLLSQTTFSYAEWEICANFIKCIFTNVVAHDTICNATSLRQQEAKKMSKSSDLIIVVGDQKSSNTKKLCEICQENTQTVQVESAQDLPDGIGNKFRKIGIVSGASTPIQLVDGIKNRLEKSMGDAEK